jgi:hypothetical protein
MVLWYPSTSVYDVITKDHDLVVVWVVIQFKLDELHSLYSSTNIVRVIKSRRMRWAGHVARMGEVFTGFWLGGRKLRDHCEDLGVGGRITLKWTLGR